MSKNCNLCEACCSSAQNNAGSISVPIYFANTKGAPRNQHQAQVLCSRNTAACLIPATWLRDGGHATTAKGPVCLEREGFHSATMVHSLNQHAHVVCACVCVCVCVCVCAGGLAGTNSRRRDICAPCWRGAFLAGVGAFCLFVDACFLPRSPLCCVELGLYRILNKVVRTCP